MFRNITDMRDGRSEFVDIRPGNDDSRTYDSDRRAAQRERRSIVRRRPVLVVW